MYKRVAGSASGVFISGLASFFPALSLSVGTYLTAGALLATTAQAGICPSSPGNGQICTAKDFTITSAVVTGPDECTAGEIVSATIRVGLTSTAQSRYDIGIFAGDNGEPVIDGASCSFTSLNPLEPFPPFNANSGFGGYRNIDGDQCGDMSSKDGEVFRNFQLDTILCQDEDGDGQVDISGIVTWSSNASQDICSDPSDPENFLPTSSSKCLLEPDFNLPIIVEPPPTMKVFKLALPGNLPAPGGDVKFSVEIANTSSSTDPITVTSIIDSVHGDVTTTLPPGDISATDCSVPQRIVPGARYFCTFIAEVTGDPGYVETDRIDVIAIDDDREPLTGFDIAEVLIGDAPASIVIGKQAFPTSIPEGRPFPVIYGLTLANESFSEPVEITSLVDDLYGDLSGRGFFPFICPTVPFELEPGEAIRCAFEETISGEFGDPPIVDTITADGPGIEPKSASAQISIYDVAAQIEVTKTAVPAQLPEPGGTFTFQLQIQNTSPVDTISVFSIQDNIYGDVRLLGTCTDPDITLAPSEKYNCSFEGDFFGGPGQFQVDSITVESIDDDGGTETDSDTAQVTITDIPASLIVTKTPSPSQQVNGGEVVYTVNIVNSSSVDIVNIVSLQDFPYGDITTIGGAITDTTCSVTPPIQLVPGASYSCAFTTTISGAIGDVIFDTVSAAGTDDNSNFVVGSDSAAVEIVGTVLPPPPVSVTKVANPTAIAERDTPQPVTYVVRVFNPSNVVSIRVIDVDDDIYDIKGDDPSKNPALPLLDCPLPFDLAPRASRLCAFSGAVDGFAGETVTDTVTVEVCALPNCNSFGFASDDATVAIVGNPGSIVVNKSANPTSVLTPGGPVTFSLTVVNTSASEVITLTEMVDDIYGPITSTLRDINTTDCSTPQSLAPAGGTYSCSFTADVTGLAGTELIDIITVSGEDSDGNPVSDSDSAKVEIVGELPRVQLDKTATPTQVAAPGGPVVFTAQVENTSARESLTITSLVDNVYGDLNGKGSCSTPQTVLAADIYSCEFTEDVLGDSAGLHADTIVLLATDESGDPLGDQSSAYVVITNIPFIGPVKVPVNSVWWLLATVVLLLSVSAVALRRRGERA